MQLLKQAKEKPDSTLEHLSQNRDWAGKYRTGQSWQSAQRCAACSVVFVRKHLGPQTVE